MRGGLPARVCRNGDGEGCGGKQDNGCANEERAATGSEGTGSKRNLDESPGEEGNDERKHKEIGLGLVAGEAVDQSEAVVVKDEDGPVPEVKRVRDEPDKDDGAQSEEAAGEVGSGASGGDDEGGAEAWGQSGEAGERCPGVVEKDGEGDE